MSQEKRTVTGLWVKPKSQVLFALFLSAGFAAIGLILLVLLFSLETFLQDLAKANQLPTQTALSLTSFVYFYLRGAIALSGFFGLIGLVSGLVLSHRLYGPMVPIRAHVGRLMRGEYSSRVTTRANDEFKDLVNDLNRLAEALEKNPKG